MNRLGMLVLSLVLGLGPGVSAEVVETSVCGVLANPASFDGTLIRIKGARVVAGFDEFVVEGSNCSPPAAIWLAYPQGTKGKAGPAAFLRLQPARNSAVVSESSRRAPVTLQQDSAFKRFDSLLAKPHKSPAPCLACPRYSVSATLVGRLDGVDASGLQRDGSGKPTSLGGFGNLNLYRARLVLQAVSDVVPQELDYPASGPTVNGDSRRVGSAAPDQVRRAAAAFGELGERNGVVVSFGVANEAPTDEDSRGTAESPDGILFLATFDMDRLGTQGLPMAMRHIGTHIADIRGNHARQGLDALESRAWQATFGEEAAHCERGEGPSNESGALVPGRGR
jgi:hypothetical protein